MIVTKAGNMVKKRRAVEEDLKRVNRKTISFNTRELKAMEGYFKKYKVDNKSKFMREAIITAILKKFDEDYPTLFDQEQPTLFSSANPAR